MEKRWLDVQEINTRGGAAFFIAHDDEGNWYWWEEEYHGYGPYPDYVGPFRSREEAEEDIAFTLG